MTEQEIKDRIQSIVERAGDAEVQHSKEDELRADFIKFLAHSAPPEIASLAELVLSTNDLEFERWCA